jgi:uncharacterized membrane protein
MTTERVVVGVLAFAGALLAARLTAYQLGWTGPPWEPFFGDGSQRVLRSAFSRSLPFPDAMLGMIAYLAEVVAVAWGGPRRTQTEPVAVYVYAAIAAGMAAGSAALVVLQVAVIHALCTLCLASALLSFVLVVPAATELAATSRWRTRRIS